MRFTISRKEPKILAVGRNNWQIQTICRKNSQPAQIPRITNGYNYIYFILYIYFGLEIGVRKPKFDPIVHVRHLIAVFRQ